MGDQAKTEGNEKIEWSHPGRFDVENPADLKILLNLAEKYKGKKEPIGNPELDAAYKKAKMKYYTDATIGPGFIEEFIGGIDPKTKKADQGVLKDTLEEAGLTKIYADYKKDFLNVNKAVQAAIQARKKDPSVEVPEFPTVPSELLEYIQDELGVKVTGQMNDPTRNAIKDYKNANHIDSQVTDASQQKIVDNIRAKEKALQEQKEGPAGDAPGASERQQDQRKEPPLPPRKGRSGPD